MEELDNNYSHLDWLSRSPPIFMIDGSRTYVGVGHFPATEYRVMEGCELSERFAQAVAGPHDLVVLYGSELSVRWHDKEIGHLDHGGDAIAFAADAPTPGR